MLTQLVSAALLLGAMAPMARAQCADWSAGFGTSGVCGEANVSRALAAFDSGAGPELYVSGLFDGVGDAQARGIAKWNGSAWSPVLDEQTLLLDMAVFDDGAGPALYVGGTFNTIAGVPAKNIARFDGVSWSPLGSGVNASVRSLVVHDDGSGPALFVAGDFESAGGSSSPRVAKWNGASWSAVGGFQSLVYALASFDDGSGPALYASGQRPGFPEYQLRRWDGANWTSLGQISGVNPWVEVFAVHDDGSGPALYMGGSFDWIAGQSVAGLAKWDGVAISDVGGGVASTAGPGIWRVGALCSFDDGSGAQLFVGGRFDRAGSLSTGNVARWNGTSWSPATPGLVDVQFVGSTAQVLDLAVLPIGGGTLVASGTFASADGASTHQLARWNGAGWSPLSANAAGLDGQIYALCVGESTAGQRLFAGGDFLNAGDARVNHVASWDGTRWQALGDGLDDRVDALCMHDDGSGEALYALGPFGALPGTAARGVARWDGASWNSVGTAISDSFSGHLLYALRSFDDGSGAKLFMGGDFQSLINGVLGTRRLTCWDGVAWGLVPGGAPNGVVHALEEFDFGAGPELIVGGQFNLCGGVSASCVASWSGGVWRPIGAGLNARVKALAVHDDGSGPALYAGGEFTSSGGAPVQRVAKWNGAQWVALGAGVGGGAVNALTSFDDGAGPALVAIGEFSSAGGLPATRIATWRSGSWSTFGAGLRNTYWPGPKALAVFRDSASALGSLYVGGGFSRAGERAASNFARITNPCACDALSYCTSGTTTNGCEPVMSAVGRASASGAGSFVIYATELEGARLGHLFYGVSGPATTAWGQSTHLKCVKAPTQRTPSQPTGGDAGQCNGSMLLDWNAYLAAHPGTLGAPFDAGQFVWMQAFFRDPPSAKTTALSNGLRFLICP